MDYGSQDNVIDFMEFVAAVHLVLRGKLEDKLKWSFKVYDRDDNGKLDRSEVKHIIRVRALQLLTVILKDLPTTAHDMTSHFLQGCLIFFYVCRSFTNSGTTTQTCHLTKSVIGYLNLWIQIKMVKFSFIRTTVCSIRYCVHST